MEPILVDTSVWIDWFRGIDTPQTQQVAVYLAANQPIWGTPTILQETLQGIRDDHQFEVVKTSLLALNYPDVDPARMAIAAASLYRTLRKSGITIRKPNDCLIAAHAVMANVTLLHHDVDFDQIASGTRLKVFSL